MSNYYIFSIKKHIYFIVWVEVYYHVLLLMFLYSSNIKIHIF